MAACLQKPRDGHLQPWLAASECTMSTAETRANAGESQDRPSPRLRLKLVTIEDVRRELARLYREAKSGTRNVQDASRLAHMLGLLGRMIEGADLERRVLALEAAAKANGQQRNNDTPGGAA